MRLRPFDALTKLVKESGNAAASQELDWLLKLARTNFAACYGTWTGGPDAHDAATCALNSRLPLITGGGQFLEQACNWLYAEAQEKCFCRAPAFITGCEHAHAPGDGGTDLCVCKTRECPWMQHTGSFE